MTTATGFLQRPWVRWAGLALGVLAAIILPLVFDAGTNSTLARIGDDIKWVLHPRQA